MTNTGVVLFEQCTLVGGFVGGICFSRHRVRFPVLFWFLWFWVTVSCCGMCASDSMGYRVGRGILANIGATCWNRVPSSGSGADAVGNIFVYYYTVRSSRGILHLKEIHFFAQIPKEQNKTCWRDSKRRHVLRS